MLGAITGGGVGALVGAAVGAGAGVGGTALTGVKNVALPAETEVNFRLKAPLRLKG
jgi:outer membrane lipoprotein SlyB